ncbi:MAG: spore cortex biosynthesis protein YabQ [Ruminococcus sp.]|nr:spore cortex biosynthesis protein YabQ [Ruminococcus sp.]
MTKIIPETYFTVHEQLTLFGASCLLGAALGVIYDAFRALRIALPHNKILVALEDIAFLLIYSVFIISFTSAAARGEFRIYFVLGSILGFTVYILTVGSAVIKIIRQLFKIFYSVINVILRPFKLIYVLIYKKVIAKFVGSSKNKLKGCRNLKIPLIEHCKMLYNKKVNIHRKNVNCVGKKIKQKEQKKRSV